MRRPKYIPMTAVSKVLIIFIAGFSVAWMLLMNTPPPAAATRLGFAARIAWPVLHLVLTMVLVLAGALMFKTLRNRGMPQSRRSRKMGLIFCWITLILAIAYAGSIVAVAQDPGRPPPTKSDISPQTQPVP